MIFHLEEKDLALLAERLSPMVQRVVEEALGKALHAAQARHPEWADKNSNPCGSARAFLDAARRKEFKTFRRNRLVTARWAEVQEAIEKRKKKRAGKAGEVDVDVNAMVDDMMGKK